MFEWAIAVLLSATTGVESMLEAADRPRRAFVHHAVHVRATTRQPDRPDTTVEFDLHVDGEDPQLIVFTDARNRGRKLLLRGDKAWLFAPGPTHPVPLSPNQRLAGGASYADVARVRLATDFRGALRPQPEPCLENDTAKPAVQCQVLDLKAVVRSAPYPFATLWIDSGALVRRARYLHPSGKPARSVTHEYRERNGQTVPARTVIVDESFGEPGYSTSLEYLEFRPESLPAKMFESPRPQETGQSPR